MLVLVNAVTMAFPFVEPSQQLKKTRRASPIFQVVRFSRYTNIMAIFIITTTIIITIINIKEPICNYYSSKEIQTQSWLIVVPVLRSFGRRMFIHSGGIKSVPELRSGRIPRALHGLRLSEKTAAARNSRINGPAAAASEAAAARARAAVRPCCQRVSQKLLRAC